MECQVGCQYLSSENQNFIGIKPQMISFQRSAVGWLKTPEWDPDRLPDIGYVKSVVRCSMAGMILYYLSQSQRKNYSIS